MKSFERPRFAIYHQKTEKILNQVSVSEILLLLNVLPESERKYIFIFSPQQRKWMPWMDVPECQVPFKLERGLKSPPFSSQNLKISQSNARSAGPSSQTPAVNATIAPAKKPLAAATPLRASSPPHPSVSGAAKKSDVALTPVVAKSAAVDKKFEKSPAEKITEEIIIDETISTLMEPDPAPLSKPSERKISKDLPPSAAKKVPDGESHTGTGQTLTSSERLKNLVGSTSAKKDITQTGAGKDLENPFSSLKRAYNREKIVPGSSFLSTNPLQALDKEAAKAARSRENLPTRWIKLSGQPVVLEPILTLGQKSLVTKVYFPFIMMDQAFEMNPGIVFAVKATYLKQTYNLEVYIHPSSVEKNILKINESLDFKFFRDLFQVIGAA